MLSACTLRARQAEPGYSGHGATSDLVFQFRNFSAPGRCICMRSAEPFCAETVATVAAPPPRHARMQAAYGFTLFPLPRYREARLGRWRVVRHLASLGDGYISGPVVEPARYVLYHNRTPWMSTGLMEQESHAFHVDQARGLVIAAGFGMGMFAFAACAKPEVERVIVAERTPEVVALMRQAARVDEWPGRHKLEIVHADALATDLARQIGVDERRPDYLFADIWHTCAAPNAPKETAAMVAALRPKTAGWWGQELSFALWCGNSQKSPDETALRDYAASLGVPIPLTKQYLAFCRDAIAVNLPDIFRPTGVSSWRERWRRKLSWRH